MNRHERNIERIIVQARKLWSQGYIEDEPSWDEYERKLRQDIAKMNAAETAETAAGLEGR